MIQDGAPTPPASFALCSAVNDDFVAGYVVMIDTFRRSNPDLNPTLYVIAEAGDRFLSPASRALMTRLCGPIRFIDVEPQAYAKIHAHAKEVFGTPPRLMAAFYILEAFHRPEERMVLCLDSDMLILGSMEETLATGAGFAAVRAMDPRTGFPCAYFNTGVMAIDRERLGDAVAPDRMLAFIEGLKPRRGTGLADQAILNLIMTPDRIGYLPWRYNFTKRSLVFAYLDRNPRAQDAYDAMRELGDPDEMAALADALGARVLHFVGEKPWMAKANPAERRFAAVDALWRRALAAVGDEELNDYMRRTMARGVRGAMAHAA